jgi:hypothetical protein
VTTIICKLCRSLIQSAKPEAVAQADVLQKMGEHMRLRHQEQGADLAATYMTVQSLTSIHLLSQYIELPDTETGLRKSLADGERALFDLLGSNPSDVELRWAPPDAAIN